MKRQDNKLIPFFLVTGIIVNIITISLTNAAEFSERATPQRITLTDAVATVEETPGQIVAQRQAEVLQYKHLKEALGDDFIMFAKQFFQKNDETGFESQWNLIFSPTTSYDGPNKRNAIKYLSRFIKSLSNSPGVQDLKSKLFDIEQDIKEVPLHRIEKTSFAYFAERFPGCRIDFFIKSDGDQLGRIANVLCANGCTVKYYIKTHSGGLRSGHSSAAKLVNSPELLVYKVLENLGIGCQSHFFGRDGHDVYIATLDANTEGLFKEYRCFKDSADLNVQQQLWGNLTQLPNDINFTDAQYQQAEALIASDHIAKNFVRETVKLDLLARIMGLEDFQTNPGNYGFTQTETGLQKARAIDFRVPYKKIEEFERDVRSFKAFLNGNGEFIYSSTGAAMYFVLTKRQQHMRVYEANFVIKNDLSEFIDKVGGALQTVSAILKGIAMQDEDQITIQSNLAGYAKIIQSNFELFRTELEHFSQNINSTNTLL